MISTNATTITINEVESILEKVQKKIKLKMCYTKIAGMETEDVIQEAMIKVYRNLKKYTNKKSKIDTYLNVIIDSVIKDCLKKAMAHKNLNIVNAINISDKYDENDTDRISIEDKNDNIKIKELMLDIYNNCHLTSVEKKIITLFLSGYKFNEIAKMINYSTTTVCHKWKGIKNKLKPLKESI